MNSLFDYVSHFIPVFIGICVMLLLSSVHTSRSRIRIEIQKERGYAQCIHESSCQEHNANGQEDATHGLFEEEAMERLIVDGAFGKDSKSADLGRLAFSKQGMIELEGLEKLHAYRALPRNRHLIVFARDERDLQVSMNAFGWSAGMLLAYAIEGRMELLTR